jgi:hypothetical protein
MSAFISGSRMAMALGGTGGGGIAESDRASFDCADLVWEDALFGALTTLRGFVFGGMRSALCYF